MKINIETTEFSPLEPTRIGNVYPIKGGRGVRLGHMQVLMAITKPREYLGSSALMLVVNREGEPVGVNSYGLQYVDELQPIAFVEGLEELEFTMRSI